jgi:hypothetical protein
MPTDTFTRWATLCEPSAAPSACESAPGLCVPPEDGGRLCIVKEGRHDCPSESDYDPLEPLTVVVPGADNRDCTPCTCQAGDDGACSGHQLRICTGDNACGPLFCEDIGQDICAEPAAGNFFNSTMLLGAGVTTESSEPCAPEGGTATGQVEEAAVYTVCCR